MAWTEDMKAQAVKMYQDADPTPETSTEIIKDIADEMEQSSNGVRMVLIQAGVYVKKDSGGSSGGAKTEKSTKAGGTGRVSKESSIAALKEAIRAKGAAVDDDILDKLTGKAAVYLTEVLKA